MSQGNNIRHTKRGSYLKQTVMKGSTLSLLLQKKGLEIIHHTLKDGQRFAIGPTEGWNGFEFIYILSGTLTWNDRHGNNTAIEGDQLLMDPILEDTIFIANGETCFLYISSESMFDSLDEELKTFMDLAVSVEEKDGYTADHCHRIMKLSMKVGEKLKLASDEMYQLNIGSFLHDVGKTRIPDHILNKPSRLTDEEFDLMKKHTLFGAEMLRNTNSTVLQKAANIVEQHHERYDGSGYPFGLKGSEISLTSSIVAVVDSFDAMTSVRVYSQGRSVEEALIEIKNEKGRLFHPEVVDAFLLVMSLKN
ncbi:HD-GYP domain-containing protein [Bacillus suaedaesalsae]|uniref:HD domain-containing protein n=1 Tax=Bacillus suaedaesalsae TaxID=2810349 RepID=A0ABS2DE17_9BACI|nr:HD-GYP domain-containing protein [Bacillus suaedaesalsae]MBM6616702.1 HD domain-containing protein [Bacillus suaedaesalsae]